MNVAFESVQRARGQTYPLRKRRTIETPSARSGRAMELDRRQVLAPADVADDELQLLGSLGSLGSRTWGPFP